MTLSPRTDDLADGAAGHLVVVGIDDLDLAAERGAAGGAMPALGAAVADVLVPVQQRRDRRQLGHAVGLGELAHSGRAFIARISTASLIGEAP